MEKFTLPHDHGSCADTGHLRKTLCHSEKFATVANVFRMLDDPNRVRIYWLLCHTEACVANISAMVDMSSPAVSHHLRQLKAAGLIVSRRAGKEVHYRASESEQSRLLHRAIEITMEISCPQ